MVTAWQSLQDQVASFNANTIRRMPSCSSMQRLVSIQEVRLAMTALNIVMCRKDPEDRRPYTGRALA